LTFGLQDDVISSVEKMINFIEDVGRENDIAHPLQMTLAISDGQTLYAFRYSSEGRSRTLFHSASVATLRKRFPNVGRFSDDARAIVSEPLGAVETNDEAWIEVPESSVVRIAGGALDITPLQLRAAPKAVQEGRSAAHATIGA
jgi:glutamine amidotransferase